MADTEFEVFQRSSLGLHGTGEVQVPFLELRDYRRDPVRDADRFLYDDLMRGRREQLQLSDDVEDVPTKGELRGILSSQLGKILRMDPFVGLKHAVKEGGWDLHSEHVRIGSFGLVYPSVKALNDVYLGQIGTDSFMVKVKALINAKLGGNGGEGPSDIFYTNFKGGSFLLDLERFASAHGVPVDSAVSKLKEVLKDLQIEITAVLQEEIDRRVIELTSEQLARKKRIREIGEVPSDGLDTADELSRLNGQLERIKLRRDRLGRLSISLGGVELDDDGGASVSLSGASLAGADGTSTSHAVPGYLAHVSFCLNRPEIAASPDSSDTLLYLSLSNAQRGVAMNALRTFRIPKEGSITDDVMATYAPDVTSGEMDTLRGFEEAEDGEEGVDGVRKNGDSMRSVVQEFNYVHFLMDLVRARCEMNSEVLQRSDDGSNVLKPEWESFFYLDANGNIRMLPDMIMQFRKERISREYTGELKDDPKKRRIFAKYYDKVNVIDILKNFRFENSGYYLERVNGLLDLADRIKASLSNKDADSSDLLALAREADAELDILVKDEGEKIARTTRSALGNLFGGENTGMLFADHIGFGGTNQADHERITIELIDKLHITPEELDSIYGTSDGAQKAIRWHLLIKEKFDTLRRDADLYENFVHLMLSVGDEGTKHIRAVERKFAKMSLGIGAELTVAVGGDEVAVFAKGISEDHSWLEALKISLLNMAQEYRLRIFVVLDDRRTGGTDTEPIVLARYIRSRRAAEEAHGRMKKSGDTSPVEVVLMSELLSQ